MIEEQLAQIALRMERIEESLGWLPKPGQKWLSVKQASTYLGVSVSTINRLLAKGRLTPKRIERAVRIERTQLDRLMAKDQKKGGIHELI